MLVVTTHMRLRAAAMVGRFTTLPFSCKGATDMPRLLLLIASLFVLGASQTALAAEGQALYEATCIACHGAKAQGAIPGVPDLAKGGRLSKPDAELVANILNGFQSNGSAMAMPPKGGNPKLTAADAEALVIYMRALTGKSPTRPVSVAPKRDPASATPIAAAAVPPPSPTPATAPLPAAVAAPASPGTTAATSAAAPSPQSAAAPAPQDMTAFARGAKAWADNCSRCHSMRDPKDLTDRQWKVVMTHMRLRAGLDAAQVRDITLFLQGSN